LRICREIEFANPTPGNLVRIGSYHRRAEILEMLKRLEADLAVLKAQAASAGQS
jgi:hypothetical protein